VRHSRSTRASSELAELRDQLRDGVAILAADLASMAPAGGDIYPAAMGKSSLEFRATLGASIICGAIGTQMSLPPDSDHSDGRRFTYLARRVDPGHGVLIFDEGALPDSSDDLWLSRLITAVDTPVNPCGASPWVAAADAGLRGFQLTLDAPLTATARLGAPVRILERVRYALYQSGDNRWYLGYCASATMAMTCATLQPLSGPYMPPNADQTSGLSGLDLYYFDVAGVATTDPLRVARIDVAFRAATRGPVAQSGGAGMILRDTLRFSVNLHSR
jgi:hypothetical protein